MKQKKYIVTWLVILSLVLINLPSAIIVLVGHNYDFKNNSYMFEDIDDFSFLDSYIISETIMDPHSSFLSIAENLTLSLKYNNTKHKLFAYSFASVEDALTYADRISDNNYRAMYQSQQTANFHYSESANHIFFVSNQCLIVSGNKVIVIKSRGNPNKHVEFIAFVMEHLPQRIDFQT